MRKILQYGFIDLLRSKWMIGYGIVFFCLTSTILYLIGDFKQVIISMMYLVLYLIPLLSMVLGIMYGYQIREYIAWVLSHPVSRRNVFMGYYLSLSLVLIIYFLIGMGIPFLIAGVLHSSSVSAFAFLMLAGIVLSFIFSGMALWVVFGFDHKLLGLGMGLFIWLVMAVLYDVFFLIAVITFQDYPLEVFAIVASILNPVDLSRILLISHLDISALLGYTGAVIKSSFGTYGGLIWICAGYLIWLIIPVWRYMHITSKKDF